VTTNIQTALELLKDVAKIAESIPYLEGMAGLLSTALKTKEVSLRRLWWRYSELIYLFRKWMDARMNGRTSRSN